MSYLFPTASTVCIFIQGVHIDLAYQVQYRESQPRVPIYGYNDYTYAKVAYGRNLVEGILVLNFSFPGYLNAVLDTLYNDNGAFVPKLYNYNISEKGKAQKERLVANIRQELRTELPPNVSPEEKSARAAYIASLISKDKNTKAATIKALEQEFFVEPEQTQIQHLYSPLAVVNDGVIMDVYYQDPTYATWFTRFHNVHFYQISQSISQAGAEGSSDPLYEVASWISSHRVTKLIQEVT